MAKNRTLLPGVAVSLLLHAVLIAMFIAPSRPEPQADARRMMVWLNLPAKPLTPVQPVKPAPAVAAVRQPKAETSTSPQQRSTRPEETVAAAQPQAQTQPQPQAPAQAEVQLPADPFAAAPAPAQGNFDVNAAMKSARKLATAKSTKGDPPVAQIYDKPLYGLPGDTPLGSSVARTARADCKNVAAGTGILALIIVPVMILTDKKDSGCKW
ncbi:hypothetical protein [Pseudoduganella aquatica]|uniref:Uncharacterized protein n=1 Tax=Pseudoduganella aquatica TaxID=2660641 RepID=A0A7X4KL70_9BURK|nr:hypothetical protein [Pseudoduganella aquatica]MYN06852.1 hypothetical protein [Pseudoduganella aquatica]